MKTILVSKVVQISNAKWLVLLCMFFFCAASAHAEYLSAPQTSTTGNFTIQVDSSVVNSGAYFWLEERVGDSGNNWTTISYGEATINVTNRPAGVYSYRLQGMMIIYDPYYQMPIGEQYYTGNPIFVTVGEAPVLPSPIDQQGYNFQVRRGHINGDSRYDIYIERADGDQNNGVLSETILTQNSDGTFTPLQASASQLATAGSWASINPEIITDDINFDGYVDIGLKNLSSISGFAGVDDQIVYSPATPYQGQATAVKAMDAEVDKFLDDIFGYVSEGPSYLNQFIITQTVYVNYVIVYPCWYYDPFYYYYDYYYDYWGYSICYYVVQGTYTINTLDFSQLDSKAFDVIAAYETAVSDPSMRADAIAEMSNVFSLVAGNTVYSGFPGSDDAYRGENHEPVDASLGAMSPRWAMWRFLKLLRFRKGTDGLYDEYINTDPNTWERHVYGVKGEICVVGQDTQVEYPPPIGTPYPIYGPTIPSQYCTVENVYCWATRQPAPRADKSDISRATNGGTEVLGGRAAGETDPITTWTDDSNHRYRNETQPGHILHDPQAQLGCADFSQASTTDDITDRCAYVERQVYDNNGVIEISTHGEGYNHEELVEVNEMGGITVFRNTDAWVRSRLGTVGQCPSGN